MNYYVIDKTDKKAYGPMATKQEAQVHLDDAIEMSKSVMRSLFPDVDVIRTDKLDEVHITALDDTIAIFEIITEDQFDDPDQIPTEFK